MKVEWKVDVSLIVASLILSLAAVCVASILAPKRYVPMGPATMWANAPAGLYLDTVKGEVGFGPIAISQRPNNATWIPTDEEQQALERDAELSMRRLHQLLNEQRLKPAPAPTTVKPN